MKGGGFKRWYGNQAYIVNFSKRGLELKEEQLFKYPYLGGNTSWIVPNEEFYFQRGITYSALGSGLFSARLSPGSFVFDVAGASVFPPNIELMLGILNSRYSEYVIKLVNPTVNVQIGDVGRIPIARGSSCELVRLVQSAVALATGRESNSELSYDFIGPARSSAAIDETQDEIEDIESSIDAEVSRLYGLNEEDISAIDCELNSPATTGSGEEDTSPESVDEEDESEPTDDLSPADWSRSWLSYALGTVLGRFEIGQPGGLGCGDFTEATVAEIRKLIDPDGIMPSEDGHKQDIAARTVACLELMLGVSEARERIRLATDTKGDPVAALRGWLDRFTGQPDRSFWKYHHQLYRKRPVYWPFQSPKKHYTVWVFHEKLGPNTLHTLRDFVTERLNLLERQITDIRPAAATNRAKAKELEKLEEMGDDLREFATRLKAHIDAGYESCIDDGVVLNAAPLHDLLPSWKETGTSPNDPAKAWKALEAEKFEWAHQAMRHWPERVTNACRTNRSFAIAHSLEHLCPADPPKKTAKKPGRKAKAETEDGQEQMF